MKKEILKLGPALLAILMWATLASMGTLLSRVPPFLLLGVGFTVGSLWGVRTWRSWVVRKEQLFLGLYGLFGYHFCLFIALRIGPVLEVNLINYLWPLFVVILTPVFFKNLKLKGRQVLAAIIGLTGAILIVTNGRLDFEIKSFVGFIFAFGAAIIWSTYTLLCRKFPVPNGSMGLFCLVSGILSFGCHFLLEKSYNPTSFEIFLMIILGLGPLGASFYLWNWAVKEISPQVLGGISYITPLLSTFFLTLVGSAQMTLVTAISIVLILLGSFMSLNI